mmetsp:Transcript_22026/g.35818  ORF Transcript_22026/g.35818 Transcript_22026/m.35818 type:complete len:325 (-) Transcript_22026:638-1612(-)
MDLHLTRLLRHVGDQERPTDDNLLIHVCRSVLKLLTEILDRPRFQHGEQRILLLFHQLQMILPTVLDITQGSIPSGVGAPVLIDLLRTHENEPRLAIRLQRNLGRNPLLLTHGHLLLRKGLSVLPRDHHLECHLLVRGGYLTSLHDLLHDLVLFGLLLLRVGLVLSTRLLGGFGGGDAEELLLDDQLRDAARSVLLRHQILKPLSLRFIGGVHQSDFKHDDCVEDGNGKAVTAEGARHPQRRLEHLPHALTVFHGGLEVGRINEALGSSCDELRMGIKLLGVEASHGHDQVASYAGVVQRAEDIPVVAEFFVLDYGVVQFGRRP